MSEKQRCAATTKKGNACKAAPLKGQNVCLAHADQETRESTGFIPDNGKGGRPKMPTPSEIARRLIEQNVLALQRPYWRTLGFDVVIGDDGPELVELQDGGAKLYGTSARDGEIVVSDHEDLGAMMTAAEKLQDRVYGKPKQQTEITGAEGGPLLIVAPPDAAAKSAKAAQLLRDLDQV